MLYYLLTWINELWAPAGFDVFQFITFRAAAAAVTSLIFALPLGARVIRLLKKHQALEEISEDLPDRFQKKAGTPTMGGLIILGAIVLPTLLWADILNIYVQLTLVATVWMGVIGFIDDYRKCILGYPRGLAARYKLVGQVILGTVVGGFFLWHPQLADGHLSTTVPFLKNASLCYGLFVVPVAIFIIAATSNAVNLTDGLDGLAAGVTAIVSVALAGLCYLSGHSKFANYLGIIYLPGSEELTIYCVTMFGATLSFLWFNSYPAEVFMGDTGSLAIGGAIGAVALLIKKELFLPVLGGIFFVEALSSLLQIGWFKYTRRKYGAGRRIFLMAPIHLHFEKLGWPETKIVARFLIVAVILAIATLSMLKLR